MEQKTTLLPQPQQKPHRKMGTCPYCSKTMTANHINYHEARHSYSTNHFRHLQPHMKTHDLQHKTDKMSRKNKRKYGSPFPSCSKEETRGDEKKKARGVESELKSEIAKQKIQSKEHETNRLSLIKAMEEIRELLLVWNRDINAAVNMRKLGQLQLQNIPRPTVFCKGGKLKPQPYPLRHNKLQQLIYNSASNSDNDDTDSSN